MHLEVLLSPHGVYKELTCEFLASMRSQFDELDRAELDQGWGITFLAKGEKKMVTFRQLEICLGSLWRRNQVEHQGKGTPKEFGLQSLMECTLPQGPRLLRSGAQCLRYVHKALANTFFARKATGQSMREKLDGHQVLQDQPLIEHKELDGRPPVYTLVGHEADLREEEPELDRAEDRAEIKLKIESRRVRIWVSLSAIILRSMRLQG
ncbi:unnamed protein product [Microthlaspi erraticum]|uniref:Arabidopsis retrotransposon Orf1 C-terminal domain-containing protein n=1 Tax=Microthlaspi erraticum TaxID=1685480 RepID=A0A6D2HS70_9BRAS|nr:unnamed protein product [Microthlaspi erraticum]